MKKLLLILLISAWLLSCKKDQSTTPPGKLVSVRAYVYGGLARLDTFIYNSNGYLQTQTEVNYGPGIINPGQATVTFSYSGSNADPSSYSIADGYGTTTYALTYDSKGRLAQDTTSPDQRGRSSTFSYTTNAIVCNSSGHGTTDSLYVANSNLVKLVEANIPPGQTATGTELFSFSPSYANPFFTVGQNQNMRTLLTKIDKWEFYPFDYISANAFTIVNEHGTDYSRTYATDASGRIVRADYSTGGYLIFTYQ